MSFDKRTRSSSHPQPLTQRPPSLTRIRRPSPPRYSEPKPITERSDSTPRRSTSCKSAPRARTRSSSAASLSVPFLFTPSTPPVVGPRPRPQNRTPSPVSSSSQPHPLSRTTKSSSSPHLAHHVTSSHTASFLAQFSPPRVRLASGVQLESESEQEQEDDGMLYTAKKAAAGGSGFRTRFLGRQPKSITTAPGQIGAGETETETDEPPRQLPTSRIVPASGPLVPPNTLEQVITPLLFEASRLLSVVPAVFGFLYNMFYVWYPPLGDNIHWLDYLVSALWALLTGYQCLNLATGLLHRWKVYYPPLSTLIRLLALQAICWPATHLTLSLLDYTARPVVCWAVIGSTTSVSRAIQLWVTSNLWWEVEGRGQREGWRLKLGGRWGGRRWDWPEVMVKCGVPMGVCYFVMAWAEALRRELGGC